MLALVPSLERGVIWRKGKQKAMHQQFNIMGMCVKDTLPFGCLLFSINALSGEAETLIRHDVCGIVITFELSLKLMICMCSN